MVSKGIAILRVGAPLAQPANTGKTEIIDGSFYHLLSHKGPLMPSFMVPKQS